MTPNGRSKRAKAAKESRKSHRIVIRDSAVQFFYDNAGYSYDPKTETPEQGRLRCAEALAKAERYAADNSLVYTWQDNQDGCIGCKCDNPDCACSHGEPHRCEVCLLWNAEQTTVLASLGSICEASSEYMRVIEAELALEAMPN